MTKKLLIAIGIVALVGLFAYPIWAQGPGYHMYGGQGRHMYGGPGYHMMGPGNNYGAYPENLEKKTIDATVEEINAPFLTVKVGDETATLFAGPMHAWVDEGFTASKGDRLKVEAAEIGGPWGKRLVAFNITNLSTDKELKLRNEDGYPTRHRGRRFGPGHRGYGPGYCYGY